MSYRRPDESVCIDWLTFTGPIDQLERVKAFLCGRCGLGDPDPDNNKGGKFYSRGYHWGCVALLYNPDRLGLSRFMLQLPGEALQAIRETIRVSELCRFMVYSGAKCTRVDIAVDFYGEPGEVSLVQQIAGGCERGELVGPRKIAMRGDLRSESGGLREAGGSVSLGRRGSDGSGKYIRVYDKGLETGLGEAREWHRFEVEFGGDCAAQLTERLCEDLPETRFRGDVLGAVDFLDNPGARRRDRQRTAWWAAIIDGDNVRVITPRRRKTTLDGVRQWIDTAVAGALVTYAMASEKTIDQVVAELIGKVPGVSKAVAGSQGFRDWCRHLGIPYWEGLRRAGLEAWTKAHGVERRMYAELAERFAASAAHPDLVMATSRRRLT